MTYYKSAFITLNDVIKQYGLTDSAATGVSATTQAVIDAMDSTQRELLKQLILDTSDEIIQDWQRTFIPFQATYTVRPSMQAWSNWRYESGILRYYLQDLEFADLLSLSSVEIDDTALSASAYRVESMDAITFDRNNTTLPTASSFTSKVEFAGIWGYHENYSLAWKQIGTLQASLNSSATSFVATAGTVASFEIYQYLKIDDEFLFVTDVLSTAPYTITVERGVRGTTAAAHDSADSIQAYQQMPDVIRATRRRVINLMQKRAELANLVQIGESAVEASTEKISLKIPVRYVAVKSI
jgi:hypothetical protein